MKLEEISIKKKHLIKIGNSFGFLSIIVLFSGDGSRLSYIIVFVFGLMGFLLLTMANKKNSKNVSSPSDS